MSDDFCGLNIPTLADNYTANVMSVCLQKFLKRAMSSCKPVPAGSSIPLDIDLALMLL